jgi:hypothetical protein
MLAARHRLLAVYTDRFYVTGGDLISYGPDRADQFRLAAPYVDRILRGRDAGRSPGPGTDQVRNGAQSQDRQGPRPRRSADAVGTRRRGHRIGWRMAGFGTHRQCGQSPNISAIGGRPAAWLRCPFFSRFPRILRPTQESHPRPWPSSPKISSLCCPSAGGGASIRGPPWAKVNAASGTPKPPSIPVAVAWR